MKKRPRWSRHKLAAEHGEPECVYETLDIGPFTIDVYEDGTWEIESYSRGKTKSMARAKHVALNSALEMIDTWQYHLEKLAKVADGA